MLQNPDLILASLKSMDRRTVRVGAGVGLGLVVYFPHPPGPLGQAIMFREPLLQLVDVPQGQAD